LPNLCTCENDKDGHKKAGKTWTPLRETKKMEVMRKISQIAGPPCHALKSIDMKKLVESYLLSFTSTCISGNY
jgi:hypothetical protein